MHPSSSSGKILPPGPRNWFSDKHMDQVNLLHLLFQYFSCKDWWERDILAFGRRTMKMLIRVIHTWNIPSRISAWLTAANRAVLSSNITSWEGALFIHTNFKLSASCPTLSLQPLTFHYFLHSFCHYFKIGICFHLSFSPSLCFCPQTLISDSVTLMVSWLWPHF